MDDTPKPTISVPAAFQWIVGILLSVIAYFLISTYVKIERVETIGNNLLIKDSGNDEWKKSIEKRVNILENLAMPIKKNDGQSDE